MKIFNPYLIGTALIATALPAYAQTRSETPAPRNITQEFVELVNTYRIAFASPCRTDYGTLKMGTPENGANFMIRLAKGNEIISAEEISGVLVLRKDRHFTAEEKMQMNGGNYGYGSDGLRSVQAGTKETGRVLGDIACRNNVQIPENPNLIHGSGELVPQDECQKAFDDNMATLMKAIEQYITWERTRGL